MSFECFHTSLTSSQREVKAQRSSARLCVNPVTVSTVVFINIANNAKYGAYHDPLLQIKMCFKYTIN